MKENKFVRFITSIKTFNTDNSNFSIINNNLFHYYV